MNRTFTHNGIKWRSDGESYKILYNGYYWVPVAGSSVPDPVRQFFSLPSDPFGDAIKAAQDLPEPAPAKGYVPDTFSADDVWQAVMEHRS